MAVGEVVGDGVGEAVDAEFVVVAEVLSPFAFFFFFLLVGDGVGEAVGMVVERLQSSFAFQLDFWAVGEVVAMVESLPPAFFFFFLLVGEAVGMVVGEVLQPSAFFLFFLEVDVVSLPNSLPELTRCIRSRFARL